MPWTYEVGVPGRAGIPIGPRLTGASHPTAGEIDGVKRNAYSLAPGAGQAASAHSEVRGVLAPDEGHSQQVDGHPDSHVAQHPDGRFAMNTAASSEHSLNANVKHHMQNLGLMGVRTDARTLQTVDSGRSWAETEPTGRLLNNREQRLGSSRDTEAMVKIAQHERSRRMSFLSLGTEWSGYQLGIAALALYVMFR